MLGIDAQKETWSLNVLLYTSSEMSLGRRRKGPEVTESLEPKRPATQPINKYSLSC